VAAADCATAGLARPSTAPEVDKAAAARKRQASLPV
jgi:hypothetical protein